MKKVLSGLLGSLILCITLLSSATAATAGLKAKTVVLVHGAFADGSSWNRIIPSLENAGLEVIAVQNPLRSLTEDVAFATRAIENAEGPVVLVGHSWGGMVITQAGVHDKVKSLVYIAAFAPSKGESLHDTAADYETPPGLASLKVDEQGYLSLTKEGMEKYFAQDLPVNETHIMAMTQGHFHKEALDHKVSQVAWEQKPSWFMVTEQDYMIQPDLLRAFAKKIKANTVSVDASHVPMLSTPRQVADMIIDAAR